jgi:hypothetical protein
MRTVILIDTSVYLNILKVPGFDQQQQTVHADFRQYLSGNARFLLPMATIWETGNHIAHLGDGRLRRQHALRFIEADGLPRSCPAEQIGRQDQRRHQPRRSVPDQGVAAALYA